MLIEKLFRSKKNIKKYSLDSSSRALHLIERMKELHFRFINKLKITKQSLNRVLRDLIKINYYYKKG